MVQCSKQTSRNPQLLPLSCFVSLPPTGPYTNEDCNAWGNKLGTLCYNCQTCKAGLLDNVLRNSWKKVAQVNIVILIFLIVVYSVGCCAFSNNRKHIGVIDPYV
ncbi:hypothetical protein Bca52824_012554 [Brassica carinata]|uniref:Senescence-associated protein n=1 Tax=Brassica carinata TaxID=52824 RepID=A0A8X7VX18_BRACI|nr:hypothetical protein Bca52824_012554 [Brassica carinata]